MRRIIPKGGLIVSCQALPGEVLHGSDIMAAMALAAEEGGASGIRANGASDIRAIREKSNLPIIGLVKKTMPDSPVYITPTLADAMDLVAAGADIVAIDATTPIRPDGLSLDYTIQSLHDLQVSVMCDISTLEEGIAAEEVGADFISTTLSGYTPQSRQSSEPDYQLIAELVHKVDKPVVAEGKIWTPQQAVQALQCGASFVVVGTAITRPMEITMRFVSELRRISTNNLVYSKNLIEDHGFNHELSKESGV